MMIDAVSDAGNTGELLRNATDVACLVECAEQKARHAALPLMSAIQPSLLQTSPGLARQ